MPGFDILDAMWRNTQAIGDNATSRGSSIFKIRPIDALYPLHSSFQQNKRSGDQNFSSHNCSHTTFYQQNELLERLILMVT